MSFFLDPPALFFLGMVLYFAGVKWNLTEEKSIATGIIIVFLFIFVSVLLYLDAISCFIPFLCGDLSGSEFMLHSNITGIYKKDVPPVIVVLLFALYPFWLYSGHAVIRKFSGKKSIIRQYLS